MLCLKVENMVVHYNMQLNSLERENKVNCVYP